MKCDVLTRAPETERNVISAFSQWHFSGWSGPKQRHFLTVVVLKLECLAPSTGHARLPVIWCPSLFQPKFPAPPWSEQTWWILCLAVSLPSSCPPPSPLQLKCSSCMSSSRAWLTARMSAPASDPSPPCVSPLLQNCYHTCHCYKRTCPSDTWHLELFLNWIDWENFPNKVVYHQMISW